MSASRSQIGPLYLTRFASSFGYTTVLILLPTYIDLLQPSGIVIGLFTTALTLSQAVAVIPLGWAGDRYDKRSLLLASLAVSAAAYLLFGVIGSSLGFIAARVLQGLGLVGAGLLSLALVSELAPADDRALYIGRYNAVRMAAGIGGTLGAGALYQLAGFDTLFTLIAGMAAAAFVGVLVFTEPDGSSIEGVAFSDLAVNRRILTLTSFRAQYAFAVTIVRNWVPIYVGVAAASGGLGFAPVLVGVVVAAEKFTNMLCQPVTGRLSDRHGRALFVFLGGGCYAVVAATIPLSPLFGSFLPRLSVPILGLLPSALLPVAVLSGLLGVADSLREPASMALFADEGAGAGIASSFGIRSIVWRPGSIVAPLVGGVLMTEVGMAWVFIVGGVAAASGVATFFLVLYRDHGAGALSTW